MNLSATKQLHVAVRCSWNYTSLLVYGTIKLNCYLRLTVNNSMILWWCIYFACLSAEATYFPCFLTASGHVYWCVCPFMHPPESRQLASSMEAGDRWAVSRGSRLIDVFWG